MQVEKLAFTRNIAIGPFRCAVRKVLNVQANPHTKAGTKAKSIVGDSLINLIPIPIIPCASVIEIYALSYSRIASHVVVPSDGLIYSSCESITRCSVPHPLLDIENWHEYIIHIGTIFSSALMLTKRCTT